MNISKNYKFEECNYHHLHLHSDYSLLDGFGTVEEYANKAKNYDRQYLCISDHQMLGCVPDLIKYCAPSNDKDDINRHKRLTPIFAIELYCNPLQIAYDTKEELEKYIKTLSPEELKIFRKKGYHLLAIAYNNQGYNNLVKLSSLAWTKGFYHRARVNHEQLVKYKEGIIFTSCCYASEIGQAFDSGGEEAGFKMIEKYISMFAPNFYLEIMLLDFSKQKPYDIFILKAKEKYNLKLIITNDVHYLDKEDSKYQRYMLMIQTKNTLKDIERKQNEEGIKDLFELQDTNLWMKTEDELNEKWLSDYSDVIDYELFKEAKRTTYEICQKATGVTFDRGMKLPKFPDSDLRLKEEIMKGFSKRNLPKTKMYLNRIKEEYELICRKEFSSYFLIDKMITDEARRISPEILNWRDSDGSEAVGPGRGCIYGDILVVLDNGYTKISEVEIGNKILTRDGTFQKVLNKLKYNIDNEDLLNIKCHYGDNDGVTLTKDHKVLVSKNGTEELKWIKAEEITLSDGVFVPKPILNNEFEVKFVVGNKIESEYEFDISIIRSFFWSLSIPTSFINSEYKYTMYFPVKDDNYKIIDDGILLKIKSIDVIKGVKEVYDLTVENNSNYMTSSFLVHNSAAGSLICYCLGITDVDPIQHDLLFSRFLSPSRGGKSIKLRFTQDALN